MQTIRIFSNISGMFGFNVWKYFFIRIIKTKIDEFGNILLVYFLFANGKEQYLGIIRISSPRFLIIREIIVGAWWEISRTEQSFSPFSCQLLDCWKSFHGLYYRNLRSARYPSRYLSFSPKLLHTFSLSMHRFLSSIRFLNDPDCSSRIFMKLS